MLLGGDALDHGEGLFRIIGVEDPHLAGRLEVAVERRPITDDLDVAR